VSDKTDAKKVRCDSGSTHNAQGEQGDIMTAIQMLSTQMTQQFTSLSQRIDELEQTLERKLLAKIDSAVDEKIQEAKTELSKEVSEVKSDVQKLKISYANVVKNGDKPDISLNIVVRNLPESENENVEMKVNDIIRDGLKLSGIQVSNVVRKRAFRESDNGVVVATCADNDQKRTIMVAKTGLQQSKKYEQVFIEHDKSREERVNSAC
jgi:hypothetical protein